MKKDETGLDAAYALETPEDSIRLYADWADTYDESFAKEMAYLLPWKVSKALVERSPHPIETLDVGAGTGLVAEALPDAWRRHLVGLDISEEMLAVAQGKGLYRETVVADLTQPLDLAKDRFDAVVSAGTFTHGHLGPDTLDALLALARTNAIFVLSVNNEHFERRGFAKKFGALADQINDFEDPLVRIYGAGADADHADDHARIVSFRKR